MYIVASKQPFSPDHLLDYNLLGHEKGPLSPLATTFDIALMSSVSKPHKNDSSANVFFLF